MLDDERRHSHRETPGPPSTFSDHRRWSAHAGLGQRRETHDGSSSRHPYVLEVGEQPLVGAAGSQ
ncbi:MAG: hypothetical protein ACRDQZ_01455 [Mycobacteriales bacterium]